MALNSYYNTPRQDIYNINTPNPAPTIIAENTVQPATVVTDTAPANQYTGPMALPAAKTAEVYPGPLDKKYVHTEGVPSIDENGERTGDTNFGYLNIDNVKGSDGIIRKKTNIYFNKDNLKPNPLTGQDDIQQLTSQRTLALMADAIDSGHASMVQNITDQEAREATKLFANENNRGSMNAITRAYALVKRSTDSTYKGDNDDAVNGWSSYFEHNHSDQSPGQFIARGDVQVAPTIITDEFASQREAVSKIRHSEVMKIADIDPQVQRNLDAANATLFEYRDKLDNINKQAAIPGLPPENVKSLQEQATNIGHSIKDVEASISVNQASITLYNAKREAALANASLMDTSTKRLQEIDKEERESIATTNEAVALKRTMIGANPGDADKYWGMISRGLTEPAFRNFATQEPVYDKNGRRTGETRVVKVNPLDVPQYLIDRGKFKMLASLGSKTEDKERLFNKETGIDAASFSFKSNIALLQKLYKGNEEIMASGNVLKQQARKIFYDSANSSLSDMAQAQKSLVGKIRVPFEGPGKMSNFEFQQLLENIPNPTDTFQVAGRVKARLQAISMISALDFINHQTQNGLVPTTETFRKMNAHLSGIIGRNLTPEDFQQFYTESKAIGATYESMEGDPRAQKELAARHIKSLYDLMRTPEDQRNYGGLETPAKK